MTVANRLLHLGSPLGGLFLWGLLGGLPVLAPAQSAPDEKAFLLAAALKLDAYATLSFKNGYPRKAREVWLEVIAEYDADDEGAREALGFTRVGTAWHPKRDFAYPEQDTPNAVVAANLHKRWESLAKDLGDGHRNLGTQLQAAGNEERARYHFDRALRFLPNDSKAGAALGRSNFEGFLGTDAEIQILKRSRIMDRSVARLIETQVPVETLTDASHPVLQKAGVPYIGVKTEHFTVYGDWDRSVLEEAAAYAERSLAFCADAYAGYQGFPPAVGVSPVFAFFTTRETWAKVVRANADSIGASQVEFIVKNTSANKVGGGKTGMHLAGVDNVESVRDLAVRWVAQEYTGVASDGMVEGVGHAIVGLFFGRNLIFTVGREEQQGTAASRNEQKLLLPDMETWKDLAIEMAWQRTGTSAAKLPLLKAASFPSDGRIKAWSFCDYLLRLDPLMLRALDRTAAKSRHENDVKEQFREATGQDLDQLEEAWRQFWTEDSPLKRAIQQKVTPLEAVSKDAPKWLEEFNRIRRQALPDAPGDLGWSAALSADCRQHVEYLKQNRGERGPEREHTQDSGKDGYSNIGRTFAASALVSAREKDPKKAMADWLHWPGYRDGLLNRNIDTVGLYVDGNIAVLDVDRGRAARGQATMSMYPTAVLVGNKAKDPVPASVDVADLGADVQKLLQQHGRGKQKTIGYPMSLHFYGGDAGQVTCVLSAGGELVEGVLVNAAGGGSRRTSARGMWVFYPLEPLRRGVECRVVWDWHGSGGPKEVNFTTM